ncbi:hypothetical protein PFMC_06061 [Plasmodium falciparum CAMP/Malaysia]|uniref:Erythrocyte membrane protein 1 n=1 Tax=Plasmodium falciparum (isolate Camp / Malaysia) TaxID=5835 RepID=A0A024WYH6_PLAFC|nr:hypothetical protein PFMC_06061 [Plasmodium falciparum CAMP/Malaysia]
MGNTQSSEEEEAKTPSLTESHNSARNVLENIGIEIYNEEKKKVNGYTSQLKGTLWQAQFHDGLHKAAGWGVIYGPGDSCNLDHKFHTNIPIEAARNPCYGREQNRFGEDEGFECGNRIRDYNKKDSGTSCAPPRRRHICDKNLEYLNNNNTDDTDDLLGNVLVTAKYEGQSIVENHPQKGTSEVCTALARSFADIGDIVRGRDMFKPNEEDAVQKGLRAVFKKIHDKLKQPEKDYYNADEKGNYYKLREDWWALNRDQVWRAITCAARYNPGYFKKSDRSTQVFSNRQCGHNEGAPPTNLDYVPQYLRWFNEWAEEFCRIKKIKLENVKEACRGDNNDRYCDGDGFDCTQTDISCNILFVDLKCPSCANSCTSYKQWLKKKEGEFNKQKEKYEKEINDVRSNSHSTYDKEFYNKLKTEYSSFKKFAATLKEVLYCNDNNVHKKLDFNIPNVTFSNSDYCSSCPVFGVQCKGGNCSNVIIKECTDIMLRNTKGIKNKREVININMLVSDNSANGIAKELKDFCENTNIFKGIRNDEWSCGYLCNLDVCDLTNDNKNLHIDKRVTIRVVFKRWLEYFLKDYNRINENLNQCINNVEQNTCINECKKKCACIEKWAELKLKEWECVRNRYYKQYKKDNSDIYHFVRTFLKDEQFQTDLKKAKEGFKELHNLEDSSKCTDPDPSGNKECKQKDVVESLLYQLQKKIKTCQEQREENGKKDCIDMPKSPNEDDDEEQEETTSPKSDGGKCCSDGCDIINGMMEKKDEKGSIDHCNAKGEPYEWQCNNDKFIKDYEGACMPPRRQKLCIHNLKDKNQSGTEQQLKYAFMKCAAKEIYFLWIKFKEDKQKEKDAKSQNDEVQNQLNRGTIPEEFERQMFYTYGDFKDLCLGKDIGKPLDDVLKVKNNIDGIFSKKGRTTSSGLSRETWWENNKSHIWQAMVCGLSHHISDHGTRKNLIHNNQYCSVSNKLEEFVKTPQFLRWMIEWVDSYCKKQSQQYNDLKEKCKGCKDNPSTEECKNSCKLCKEECEKYKKFITKWKGQWITQSNKYETLYKIAISTIGTPTEQEKLVVDHLKDLQSKTSGANTYNSAEIYVNQKGYINDCDTQYKFDTSDSDDRNYAFSETPHGYGEACKCKDNIPKPAQKKEEKKVDDTCKIAEDILKDETEKKFADACAIKYGKKSYHGWDCRPSAFKKGQDEGACMPPRRRKLYLKYLKDLKGETSQIELRKAFIECGAIERFFAWHKYKKDIERENKEKQEQGGGYIFLNEEQESSFEPDAELDGGTIPEEFKHQMFYTFLDYKDIFFGKDMGKDVGDVENNIDSVFSIFGQTTSDKKRKEFWETYGKDIWNGMVCTLANSLTEAQKKMKIKNQYSYDKLKNSKSTTPSLEDIAKKPQFIRWFEEWAEEFCRKRKIKLEKVKEECRGENDSKHCSGDGHDCTETDLSHYNTFIDLHCPRCGEECMKYKKWMEKRQEEFNKQKRQYENEIKKFGSKNYDKYYEKFSKKYTPFDSFVETLKEGPHCSIKFLDGKLNFKNSHQTFGPSEYCKACPVYGVNCYWGKCRTISENTFKAKKGINGENKNDTNPTDIKVLVLGRKGESNDKELEHACKMTDLFEHSSVQKWTCRYLNQTDQCNIDNFAQHIDIDQVIAFNELFQRWLRYFVQDYNKMKDKINPCVKKENRKEQKCIKDCKKYCICVGKWLEIKEKEWKEIKKHYYKYSKSHKESIPHWVMSYFEQLYFDTAYKKAQDVVEGEVEKEKLWGCTGPNKCKPEEEQKKEDFIGNLIDRLQKKNK